MASLMELLAAKKALEVKASIEVIADKTGVMDLTMGVPVGVKTELPLMPANINLMTNAEVADIVMTTEDVMDIRMDDNILKAAAITVDDIIPRIRALNALSDMDVEKEMSLLKNALLANPAAVSLMLPEDVGLLVASRRRITQEAIVATAAKKEKKPKATALKDMSAEAIKAIDDF